MFYAAYQQVTQQAGGLSVIDPLALPEPDWPVVFEGKPELLTANWELKVSGRVAQSQTFTLDDLRQLPQTHRLERVASKHQWLQRCEWEGVTAASLLQRVKPSSNAPFVLLEGAQASVVVEATELQDAFFILKANAKPLNPWHGGPVKLVRFDWMWEAFPAQLQGLMFLNDEEARKASHRLDIASVQIQPGSYYAYDSKTTRSIQKPHDIRTF